MEIGHSMLYQSMSDQTLQMSVSLGIKDDSMTPTTSSIPLQPNEGSQDKFSTYWKIKMIPLWSIKLNNFKLVWLWVRERLPPVVSKEINF